MVRSLGGAVLLWLCVCLASGCGEPAPVALVSSSEPDFAQASRNASVQFLWHLERIGGKVLDRDKAFAYAVSTFEDAARKEALDREAFARMFCDASLVERENCLRELILLKSGWPAGYLKVHRGMQELGFNLFTRWLAAGDMVRGKKTACGQASLRPGYGSGGGGDEAEAFRNVALRILWLAEQSGLSPVPGRLELKDAVEKLRKASEEPAFGKMMDRASLLACFSDGAFLRYLALDERMSQLMKEAPSAEFRQASEACLEPVARVCAVLEQGLVKRGYAEAAQP